MGDWLVEFVREEQGQDMVEYSLLLVFVVLAAAALLLSNQKSIANIWHSAEDNLHKAEDVI